MEFPDEGHKEVCCIKTLYSTSEGFFKDLVKIVLDKIEPEWINGAFKKQLSEKDKIRISCNDKKVWSVFEEVLQNVSKVYRKKCAEASKTSREEGDWLCKKGEYKKAVMMYSQSIIRAPLTGTDKSPEGFALPLAYKGRANALLGLQQYSECLQDLNMAIKEGFPNALKYQVFRQMGECYKGLLELNKARISLQLALKLIDEQISKLNMTVVKQGSKADKNKDKMLRQVLDKEREEIKQAIHEIPMLEGETKPETDCSPVQYIQGPPPELTEGTNEKYPTASSLVTIKQTTGAGRFAVAADKIDTGATLVVEEPLASCLIPQMLASHCLHCFTRLYTPVPCKLCSGAAFCTIRCRDLALSTYHKYECELMGLFLGSGMTVLSLLALRMVTQESLVFFKTLQSKLAALQKNKEDVNFTERETEYLKVYNLMTHSSLRSGTDYLRRSFMAIFLTKCLKETDFFEPTVEENDRKAFSEDEILIAAVLLHHLELLQFNAHEIYETRVAKKGQTRDAKSVYIAVGIYPTVALFNHECSPSVTRYFNGKSIVIKSVRPLAKNDILSENYGPHYAKKSLPDRIRELSSRYWFICECRACKENWPLVEDLTDRHFKLRCKSPNCKGAFPQPRSTKPSETNPMCEFCMKKTNVVEILKRKTQVEIFFEKGLDYMENQQCGKAVPLLTSFLDEIFELVAPPCREIFLCQEALRTCFAQTGNVWLLSQ